MGRRTKVKCYGWQGQLTFDFEAAAAALFLEAVPAFKPPLAEAEVAEGAEGAAGPAPFIPLTPLGWIRGPAVDATAIPWAMMMRWTMRAII